MGCRASLLHLLILAACNGVGGNAIAVIGLFEALVIRPIGEVSVVNPGGFVEHIIFEHLAATGFDIAVSIVGVAFAIAAGNRMHACTAGLLKGRLATF